MDEDASRPASDEGPKRVLTYFSKGLLILGLLTWRTLVKSPAALWNDWVTLISIYYILILRNPRALTWSTLPVLAMAYVFGIYVQGHFRHWVSVWSLTP